MKATRVDLRYKTSEGMKGLAALPHKTEEHPYFGMAVDDEKSVEEVMAQLRGMRNEFLRCICDDVYADLSLRGKKLCCNPKKLG